MVAILRRSHAWASHAGRQPVRCGGGRTQNHGRRFYCRHEALPRRPILPPPTKEAVWTQQDQTATVTQPRTGRSWGSGGTQVMGRVTDAEQNGRASWRERVSQYV